MVTLPVSKKYDKIRWCVHISMKDLLYTNKSSLSYLKNTLCQKIIFNSMANEKSSVEVLQKLKMELYISQQFHSWI